MRMNRKKKIPKAEPPWLVHPVKPPPPPTRANSRVSFCFEMTRLELVSTRWKFRGAKRREDSGQISSGGLVSNSRSYEFMILSIAQKADEVKFAGLVSALPVLDWFIRKERVWDHRIRAMSILVKIEGKEADELVGSLASDETLNHGLSAMAIQRATERGLDLPEAGLLAALSDHHGDRRGAAALHWKKQFGADAPSLFDPVKAVESKEVGAILDEFGLLLIDSLAANAPWVVVERKWKAGADGKVGFDPEFHQGWLLQHQGRKFRILDLHGRILDFETGEQVDYEWRGVSTVSFKEQSVKNLVEEIEALRKDGDPKSALSLQGSLSGQFEGTSAGVPEMLLARQLLRSGEPGLCARILLPALESQPDDKTFSEVVKHRLATTYGYRMLVAFIGRRDYEEAMSIAGKIARDFEGTRFHRLAQRLLAELPKRKEDFRELTLPSPEKWEEWRVTHSREEQIRFLCQRLRLLNCYQ